MIGKRRGFALLAALWLLVAIGVLGTTMALLARTRRLTAANILEQTQAREASSAGVAHMRSRVTEMLTTGGNTPADLAAKNPLLTSVQMEGDPWSRADTVLTDSIPLGPTWYCVHARDAMGVINLNTASESVLRDLFIALELDAGLADRLAQSIADWRDLDDLRHPRGAERNDYLTAGAPDLPTNEPFASVSELLRVKEITPKIFTRISPYLTIYGTGQINLNAAPRPVLLALPGIGIEGADAIERLRAVGRPIRSVEALEAALSSNGRAKLQTTLSELLPLATFTTIELEVVSDGWLPRSPVRARTTVILARAGSEALVTWTRLE